MSVILHKLHGDDLDDYELENLDGIEEAWYFYKSGSYEGSGQMLARVGDLWDIHDMGHCSCYGPLEKFSFNGKTLAQVHAMQSADYAKETAELFDAVGFAA